MFDLMSFQQTTNTSFLYHIILKLNAVVSYQSSVGNENKSEEMSLIHSISVQNSQDPEPIF